VRNKLLACLLPKDFASLRPALRIEPMQLRQVLIPAHSSIEVVYFPEEGFVSITADGASILAWPGAGSLGRHC
jgi:hypothetical protein